MKPKVLILGPSPSAVSGISTHVRILLSSELRDAFELDYFQCGGEGIRQNRATRIFRLIRSPFQFITAMRSLTPAIVHVNTAMYKRAFARDVVFLFLARLLGAATVLQFHGGDLRRQTRLSRFLLRPILLLPDSIVVISREDLQFYGALVGKNSVCRIENGVPVDDQCSASAPRFREKQLRLAHIGRLVETKGLLDILDALSLLEDQESGSRFSLEVAGTGPLMNRAKQYVQTRGLESSVKFLGPVFGAALIDLLQRTDLLVMPTYHEERLPYAILEAMAAGVPPVTCPKAAIADVVNDDIEGVFVEPRDPPGLAAILNSLSNDVARLDRMSLACRKRISLYFSANRMADDFGRLYARIIQDR